MSAGASRCCALRSTTASGQERIKTLILEEYAKHETEVSQVVR